MIPRSKIAFKYLHSQEKNPRSNISYHHYTFDMGIYLIQI